jgi:phosphoribosylamine--glycine ligase
MKILVLGSGGREHAITWKLSRSEHRPQLFAAPGNGGTSDIATNVDIDLSDHQAIGKFCLHHGIDMLVVGPEDPLVDGIVDYFRSNGQLSEIKVIGPSAAAAQLEGSKEFAKTFMKKYDIPTAAYQSFSAHQAEEACAYLESLRPPYVLKADGLAAGKGVVILDNIDQAREETRAMLAGKFGRASSKLVIEEFLSGLEFSVFVLTDGQHYLILPEAKDYKRIGEGDTGLNTGGMGAVSPVPFVDKAMMKIVEDRIIKPTVNGIAREAMDYHGFIFFGLIATADGPMVIEYNVRLGDPETEVVLPRLKSDLVELLEKCADGALSHMVLETDSRAACAVMVVSEGYPQAYEKGKEITGIDEVEDSIIFHAGTRLDNARLVTNGGRVMAFTSFGSDFREALSKSYDSINKVCYDGIQYRRDIGFDL